MGKNIEDAVVVYTSANLDNIFEEGGSGWWVLDPKRAENLKYVICVQNKNGPKSFNTKVYNADDGDAFVIGKLSGVESSAHKQDKRFILKFSEYAEIKKSNKWDGSRNPVRYVNSSDFLDMDMEKDVTYNPMPSTENFNLQPITLMEAKERLAKTFGVDIKQLSISINY
jgi:hypothetical protein